MVPTRSLGLQDWLSLDVDLFFKSALQGSFKQGIDEGGKWGKRARSLEITD